MDMDSSGLLLLFAFIFAIVSTVIFLINSMMEELPPLDEYREKVEHHVSSMEWLTRFLVAKELKEKLQKEPYGIIENDKQLGLESDDKRMPPITICTIAEKKKGKEGNKKRFRSKLPIFSGLKK